MLAHRRGMTGYQKYDTKSNFRVGPTDEGHVIISDARSEK